jgi:hypothetical protein
MNAQMKACWNEISRSGTRHRRFSVGAPNSRNEGALESQLSSEGFSVGDLRREVLGGSPLL